MKNLLLFHFLIALVILILSGSGFFLPAGITIALIVIQRLARKFDLVKGALPEWYKILGVTYAANFLVMIVGWII